MSKKPKKLKIGDNVYELPLKNVKREKDKNKPKYEQHQSIDNTPPKYPDDTYRPIISHKMRLNDERIYTPFFTFEYLWRYKELYLLCLEEDANFKDYVKNQVGEGFEMETASKYELSFLMFDFYNEDPTKIFKIIKKLRRKTDKDLFNGNLEEIIKEQLPTDPDRKNRDTILRKSRVIYWENKKNKDDFLRNPHSPEEVKEPSLMKMAGNLASAMKSFAGSGFLRVTKEQHAERMTICNGCEFWKADARFGLGKCLKCGCTGAKQWIATSVCPINKCGAISKEEVEASLKEKENAEAQETQSPVSQQDDGSSQEPSTEVQG